MRVTLDQARQDGAARRIDRRRAVAPLSQHRLRGPYPDDPAVTDRDGAVREQLQLVLLGSATRRTAIGDPCQLRSMDDVEVARQLAHRNPRSLSAFLRSTMVYRISTD